MPTTGGGTEDVAVADFVGSYEVRAGSVEATLDVTASEFSFLALMRVPRLNIAAEGAPNAETGPNWIELNGTTSESGGKVSLQVTEASHDSVPLTGDSFDQYAQCSISAADGSTFKSEAAAALMRCIGIDDSVVAAERTQRNTNAMVGIWAQRGGKTAIEESGRATFYDYSGTATLIISLDITPTYFTMTLVGGMEDLPQDRIDEFNRQLQDFRVRYIIRNNLMYWSWEPGGFALQAGIELSCRVESLSSTECA